MTLQYLKQPYFQLSEVSADLNEEHSAATLASERLEAEQGERMKLEKERAEMQVSIIGAWEEWLIMILQEGSTY